MKRWYIFLVFLAALQAAHADEAQIFSGKLITDTDLEIDDKIFRFSYDEVSEKIFAQNPALNLIIGMGDCKINDFFKICFNSAEFDHKNITSYKRYYEVDVEIYEFDYGIKFNSTSPGEALQGEQFDFKFSFYNPTTSDIQDFSLSMEIVDFAVTELKGCDFDGNTLTWKGDLAQAAFKSCSMKLNALRDGKLSLDADLDYLFGFTKVSQTKELASIDVLPDQLKIESNFDARAELSRPFYLNFSITNSNPTENMDVKAVISFPRGVDFLKEEFSYDKSTSTIKEAYWLEPGKSKNYSYYMKSDGELKSPFTMEFTYEIKDVTDVLRNVTFINVTEPVPVIDIFPQSFFATPSQSFVVLVKITNPSPSFTIERLKGTLSSKSNSNIVEEIDSLKPNETYPIISHTIIIPPDSFEEYTVKFDIEYWVKSFKRDESKFVIINITNSTNFPNSSKANSSLSLSQQGQVALSSSSDEISSTSENSELSSDNSEDFASAIASFANLGGFQKIFLIFGAILLISMVSIFVVFKKLKAKKEQEISEMARQIKPQQPNQ